MKALQKTYVSPWSKSPKKETTKNPLLFVWGVFLHCVCAGNSQSYLATLVSTHTAMADNSGLTGAPLGIAIAVISSFINGSTFVLQKKGILRSRDKGRGEEASTDRLGKIRDIGDTTKQMYYKVECNLRQRGLKPFMSCRVFVPYRCGVVQWNAVQWVWH